MVVSQNRLASEAGIRVMKSGGNAVDGAIATALVLAVTLPRAGNLGGGGFMLVHEAESGNTTALNFRSTAPAGATAETFTLDDGMLDYAFMKDGIRAAAVPGTVSGLAEAHKRFGTLPWSELFHDAIRHASEGITVSHDLSGALAIAGERMADEDTAARTLLPEGQPPAAGTVLKQTDLSWSLEQIASHGAPAFYEGLIAERIVADMTRNDGLIRMSDMARYATSVTPALETGYRGHTVASMPPPGTGAIVLQMLNMFECFDPGQFPQGSARQLHLLAEIFKRAYRDRPRFLEDPVFEPVPTDGLVSKDYAQKLCGSIDLDRAVPTGALADSDPWEFDSRDTTHLSVADAEGNAVSLTYTLGSSFGSAYMPKGTGILLNNQMRTFVRPGTSELPARQRLRPIRPGKRPVSTMSPTIVKKDGSVILVTGSPGGHRIPIVIFQVLVNTLDYGHDIATATQTPRVHHNYVEDVLRYEQGLSPDTLQLLRARGHTLLLEPTMGSAQSIFLGDELQGAADGRRPGAAAIGY